MSKTSHAVVAWTYEGKYSSGSYSPPYWQVVLTLRKPEPSECVRNIKELIYKPK